MLFEDLLHRVPVAAAYARDAERAGQKLVFDHGAVRTVAFSVMLIGGVSTLLFNGNPLLRFDGYYVLADLLGIPLRVTIGNRGLKNGELELKLAEPGDLVPTLEVFDSVASGAIDAMIPLLVPIWFFV